jgi:hypothetical protein
MFKTRNYIGWQRAPNLRFGQNSLEPIYCDLVRRRHAAFHSKKFNNRGDEFKAVYSAN